MKNEPIQYKWGVHGQIYSKDTIWKVEGILYEKMCKGSMG